MSEHTKGPWQADIRTGCYAIYAGPRRNCLSGAADDAIVYQDGRGEEWSGPGTYQLLTDEQQANARLIAAACELLKALEAALMYVEIVAQPDDARGLRARECSKQARAALAKAKESTQ